MSLRFLERCVVPGLFEVSIPNLRCTVDHCAVRHCIVLFIPTMYTTAVDTV